MSEVSSILPGGVTLQDGKYKIIRVLGQGGFGITYLAEQTGLGMLVAVKEFFLKGSCQRDSSTSKVSVPVTDNKDLVSRCLKKFKSEARKIASLNNDHIVSIIDIFDENGTSYYVMKYLQGGSLADRIRLAPLGEAQAVSIIREIADALKDIHANSLLHLDIKPANILFDDRGRAVLIDFGVSKYLDNQKDTTTTTSFVGFSRGFAPLEQINATASSLSPATDIYSLGATLFNLVAGITPPDASTVINSGLPEFPPAISEAVRHAVKSAMQPRSKDRPQDVYAFLDMLPQEHEYEEEDVTVVPAPGAPSPVPSPKNRRLFAAALILFLGAVALCGLAFFLKKQPAPEPVPVVDTARVEALETEVNTLKTKNTTLQKQVNDAKGQVSSLTQSKNTLQKQVDELTRKNANQAAQVSSLQKDNADLRKQVNSYKPDAERWRRQWEVNK